MAKLDDYVEKQFGKIVMDATKQQIKDFDLCGYNRCKIEIRRNDDSEPIPVFVDTIPLQTYLSTLSELLALDSITNESVRRVLEQHAIPVSENQLNYALVSGVNAEKRYFAPDRNLTAQEHKDVALKCIFRDILKTGDNYTIYVLLPEDNMLDTFSEQLRAKLPLEMTMDASSSNVDDEYVYFSINTPTGAHGTIRQYHGTVREFSKDPDLNQLLLRWHGSGRRCADFIRVVAEVVQEQRYEAHFNVLQPQNVIGGVFYKPKESRGS